MSFFRDALIDILSEGIPDSVKEVGHDVDEGNRHVGNVRHTLNPKTIRENAKSIRRKVDFGFVVGRCYKTYRKFRDEEDG